MEEKVVMHHGEWSAVRRTYNYYRDDDDVYDDDETRDDTNHTNTNNNNTKIAHSSTDPCYISSIFSDLEKIDMF